MRTNRTGPVLITITVAAVMPLSACGGSDDANADYGSPGCDSPGEAFDGVVTIDVAGQDRQFELVVPDRFERPVPLVLAYHGFSQGLDGWKSMVRLAETAAADGFIAVLPIGSTTAGGSDDVPPYHNLDNIDDERLADDVAFASALLDRIEADYCVDRTRVHAMGFSNGGAFTATLACRLSERIASVAPVSGLHLLDDCEGRAVPMIMTHGTDDPIVKFDGDATGVLEEVIRMTGGNDAQLAMVAELDDSAVVMVDAWAEHNGCALDERSTDEPADDVDVVTFGGCEGDVVFQVIEGGGHAWPGVPMPAEMEDMLGRSTMSIDATRTALAFFEDHPLPGDVLDG